MGKAAHKTTSIESVNAAATNPATQHVATPAFSNGELGQLQEILFGQQQRSTHEQISALQNELDEKLESLGNVLNSRLNQLTETVEKSNKQFELRINEIMTDGESKFEQVNKSVNATKAELQTNISALSKSNDEDTKRLDAELAKHESKLLKEINDTKHHLQTDITQSINNLHSTKLDKNNLAQLFSDVSEKIQSTSSTSAK